MLFEKYSGCTTTYLSSYKPSKEDEQDMLGTASKSKDKHISDIFLWTSTHRQTSIGRPAKSYIHQFSVDTGCSLEDLFGAMKNRIAQSAGAVEYTVCFSAEW